MESSSIPVASESDSEEINSSTCYMPKKISEESVVQMEKISAFQGSPLPQWGIYKPGKPPSAESSSISPLLFPLLMHECLASGEIKQGLNSLLIFESAWVGLQCSNSNRFTEQKKQAIEMSFVLHL